jgi:hypothetical protein
MGSAHIDKPYCHNIEKSSINVFLTDYAGLAPIIKPQTEHLCCPDKQNLCCVSPFIHLVCDSIKKFEKKSRGPLRISCLPEWLFLPIISLFERAPLSSQLHTSGLYITIDGIKNSSWNYVQMHGWNTFL